MIKLALPIRYKNFILEAFTMNPELPFTGRDPAFPNGTLEIDGLTIITDIMFIGEGVPPPATGMHAGQQEGARAFTQMSTGEVIGLDVDTALNRKSGLTSWREK